MNFGLPVAPNVLLGMLEDYLRTRTGLPGDCVFLSLGTDDDHMQLPPSDRFVSIFPSSFPVWQSVVSGGGGVPDGFGSDHTGFDAVVRTTLYNRLTSDQEMRSSQLLRNAAYGAVNLAFLIVGALQFWTAPNPEDDQESYLREYMRVIDPPSFRPKRLKNEMWTVCPITWEMRFTALLPPGAASPG